jgi:hypothetical protein
MIIEEKLLLLKALSLNLNLTTLTTSTGHNYTLIKTSMKLKCHDMNEP